MSNPIKPPDKMIRQGFVWEVFCPPSNIYLIGVIPPCKFPWRDFVFLANSSREILSSNAEQWAGRFLFGRGYALHSFQIEETSTPAARCAENFKVNVNGKLYFIYNITFLLIGSFLSKRFYIVHNLSFMLM